MPLHVCCACGNEVECDRLDVVVELSCPLCKQPIRLEYSGPARQRYMAVLRVIEGPRFVGDGFILPVATDVVIGSGEGCWMRLPEGEVASDHCRLRMDRHGGVRVFNLGSAQGTWIDNLRIVDGVLEADHDLRVGFYRIRLNQSPASSILAMPAEKTPEVDVDGPLPAELLVMRPVEPEDPLLRLAARRFLLARCGLLGLSWILLIFHGVSIRTLAIAEESDWHKYALPALSFVCAALLWRFGGRVALADKVSNVVALCTAGVLLVLTLGMTQWVIGAGIALVTFAASIIALRPQQEEHALGATFLGGIGILTLLVPVLIAVHGMLTQ